MLVVLSSDCKDSRKVLGLIVRDDYNIEIVQKKDAGKLDMFVPDKTPCLLHENTIIIGYESIAEYMELFCEKGEVWQK